MRPPYTQYAAGTLNLRMMHTDGNTRNHHQTLPPKTILKMGNLETAVLDFKALPKIEVLFYTLSVTIRSRSGVISSLFRT